MIKVEEGEKEIRNATDDILLWKINPRPETGFPFIRGGHFKYQDLHFILRFPKVSTRSLHSAGNSEAAGQSKMCRNCFLSQSKTKQKPNNLIKQTGIRIFWLSELLTHSYTYNLLESKLTLTCLLVTERAGSIEYKAVMK